MDWDQIESKWVAMTRRVCGDLSISQTDATGKISRRVAKVDDTAINGNTDRQVIVTSDQPTAMTAQ